MSTISAIVGADLSGLPALAGAPSATLQLGTALASVAIGNAMARMGRRKAMARGLILAVLGSLLALGAILLGTFIAYLVGLLLVGAGQAATQLGRFAAAEVHPPDRRGQAIANVVLGGTVGSILGPLLVAPAGRAALTLGVEELTGPFMVACFLLIVATINIYANLRPDPKEIGREISARYPQEKLLAGARIRGFRELLGIQGVRVAISSMVIGQVVMVMLMGITSLHMKHHDHTLTHISFVTSSHTFGMFAFSVISGRLVDAWGRSKVILTGCMLTLASCIIAPLSLDLFPLSSALFLLGLGWNFCYVGGSTLLADHLVPGERGHIQGINDLMIGLSTAAASLISGLIFSEQGYLMVSIVGFLLMLLPAWLVFHWNQFSKTNHQLSTKPDKSP